MKTETYYRLDTTGSTATLVEIRDPLPRSEYDLTPLAVQDDDDTISYGVGGWDEVCTVDTLAKGATPDIDHLHRIGAIAQGRLLFRTAIQGGDGDVICELSAFGPRQFPKLKGLMDHLISMSCLDPHDPEIIENYRLDAIEIILDYPHLLGLSENEVFTALFGHLKRAEAQE